MEKGEGQRGSSGAAVQSAYSQACNCYHQIDDFRAKLLSLLPFLSGAGVFVLLKDDLNGRIPASALGDLGLAGAVVTLGLLLYELRGVQRCIRLMNVASDLEQSMGVDGPFSLRARSFRGVVNEPMAAALIYPAVLAAWVQVQVARSPSASLTPMPYVAFLFGFAFVVGFFLRYRDDLEFAEDRRRPRPDAGNASLSPMGGEGRAAVGQGHEGVERHVGE